MKIPNFMVDLKKSIKNESKIYIIGNYVKAKVYEFIKGVKRIDDDKSVVFIRPLVMDYKDKKYVKR